MLLGATACLGIGFGFVVPSLNTFTAAFFPAKVDQSILTLNALLGVGTALAPIFATIFVGLGFWWGLPILMSGLALALILFCLRLPLKDPEARASVAVETATAKKKIPRPLLALRFLRPSLRRLRNDERQLGDRLHVDRPRRHSATLSSIALTTFWITVTAGPGALRRHRKMVSAAPDLSHPARAADRRVHRHGRGAEGCARSSRIVAFGLAGLACSALLPLVISFGQEELTTMTASVAGGMIGFYQMGYGIAAFGVGPLQSAAGLSLASIYGSSSLVALALAAIAFAIAGRHSEGRPPARP